MNLNTKEIESVSRLAPFERYKYFIKRVVGFGFLWTIKDKNNDLALLSIGDNILVSLWSAEPFIKSNLEGDWQEFVPYKIDLDEFVDTYLPLILKEEYLINIFPLNKKAGFVVDVEEFSRDLNMELDNYR